MDAIEHAIDQLTPRRLQEMIRAQVRGHDGEERRGVGVATILGPVLDGIAFSDGAERSRAYSALHQALAERVALIPGMRYIPAMA